MFVRHRCRSSATDRRPDRAERPGTLDRVHRGQIAEPCGAVRLRGELPTYPTPCRLLGQVSRRSEDLAPATADASVTPDWGPVSADPGGGHDDWDAVAVQCNRAPTTAMCRPSRCAGSLGSCPVNAAILASDRSPYVPTCAFGARSRWRFPLFRSRPARWKQRLGSTAGLGEEPGRRLAAARRRPRCSARPHVRRPGRPRGR